MLNIPTHNIILDQNKVSENNIGAPKIINNFWSTIKLQILPAILDFSLSLPIKLSHFPLNLFASNFVCLFNWFIASYLNYFQINYYDSHCCGA